jgi:flagellar capping protein FliD
MYNHVDNFLGSGRWPAEHNIFRSSQANLWKPTVWQRQLLVEKMMQEEKNIRDMFSTNKAGLRAALSTYRDLALKRMQMFDKADKNLKSQEKIQDLDTGISDVITQSGDYERIPF